MDVLSLVAVWADLAAFRARMQATYLANQARYAADIASHPELFRQRFIDTYARLVTSKVLLTLSQQRLLAAPTAPGAPALLAGIGQAQVPVNLMVNTIHANLGDPKDQAQPETGSIAVVLAIGGLLLTVAAILWALSYERDSEAALTYAQAVDRETQRMTAPDAAKTLQGANPGTPSPSAPPLPKPPGSGGAAALAVGVVTVAAVGGGLWFWTRRRSS